MGKEVTTISFFELLPSSIASDEKIQAAATALDAELQRTIADSENIAIYSRIDQLEDEMLTHLAYAWHLDFWDESLNRAEKRRLVKEAYRWHMMKGTPAAIEQVLADVLGGGTVEEWWQYGGEPFHFRVVTTIAADSEQHYNLVLKAIAAAKNERSILDVIVRLTPIIGTTYHGGGVTSAQYYKIQQED